jgi:riboflavin kinase/FMN adenylyltransferase
MRLISGLRAIDALASGSVVTIGNFDGVHLGHQRVIEKLAEQGRARNLPVVVILFEPQPLEFFFPEQAPARLTRLREKVCQLARLPVDFVQLLRFDRALADLPPEVFIQRILVDQLRVRLLVVGDDFRFGKARSGDFATLQAAGDRNGFEVCDTASVLLDGERVSSTLVRHLLVSGELPAVEKLLGRPYSICGRIRPGDQRGRTIGFPTANIEMARKNAPLLGVFAVTMMGLECAPVPGVANVGIRPTVQGIRKLLLETHLFGFDGDLYGRCVEVRFHRKLRDERKFADLAELQTQIERDAATARDYFRTNGA